MNLNRHDIDTIVSELQVALAKSIQPLPERVKKLSCNTNTRALVLSMARKALAKKYSLKIQK